MKQVFVTRALPQPGIKMLNIRYKVEVNPYDRVLTKEEIISGVKDADALVCLLTDTIDKEIIDSGSNLKIISNYAVGYNNIDVNYATLKGIIVTNTPGVLSETTADLAFTLLCATARRIPEGDKFMREGKFSGWAPELMLGTDIHGKTLGLIGLGRIGMLVAKRALGFDMRVLYHSSSRKPEVEQELGVRYVELDDLLKNSDFVTLHVPLTSATKGLIGKKALALMKSTAILINTSRGEVVNEPALIEALKEKKIRGAGLDVFWGEPTNVNPELFKLDNAVLAPHMGSASLETRSKMAEMAASAVIDVLVGKRPNHIVNPEVLGA
ncbi:MAG: D-glycerate dehydrogenase [Methanomassiliicoccales archaeon]|nr:MAG: D-glycerate dehydrogenase [Methanomassiliicoccales archaeon]